MKKVREGYKMTELGEIPVDWDIECLENITQRLTGHTPDKKVADYWNGDIPWISLKDTKRLDKRYIGETTDYTTEEGINNSSAVVLPKGTVVLSRDATVGKVGITDKKMATSQHFINYVCGRNLHNIYLYYDFYNRKPLFERIGAGSTIKTIGVPFFKSLSIILPPIKEQQKIADILSTVDDQVEITDRLIEKIKELKKGFMQKLLTKGIGHSKFKDTEIGRIPEEWEIVKLGEKSYIKARIGWRGLKAEEYTEQGPLLIAGKHIKGSKIMWDFADHISQERYNESPEIQLMENDIIMSKDGTIGRVGFIDILLQEATINGTMMLIRPNEEFYSKFIYYYFQGNKFKTLIMDKVSGSSVPHIFQRDIVDLIVPIPQLKEQQKIASILSAIDEQIDQYESKKEKLQELKKGLMQKLLTGKIRVKVRNQ